MEQIIKVAWDLNENTDNRYRLVYEIAELAKKIVGMIKDTKIKVQASIQGDSVRVTGKSRDDLQDVIKAIKAKEDAIDAPLQFTNYR